MGKELRWGVCGAGMIAHDFLTALATLPLHRARAVAAKERERAQRLAAMHQLATVHDTYEDLAMDEDIDIVFVSVVNLHHYEVSRLMLEHGKHVLCEKPMGMTHQQTSRLVKVARDRRRFLLEGMWSRFFPAYDALDKHIADGGLGEVYHVNVQFGVEITDIERNLMKDLGGGAVLDLGLYMLQLVQWVYKSAPTGVVCSGHRGARGRGVEESFCAALAYGGGRTAALAAHTRAAMPNKAEIVGSKGCVTLEYFWCPTALRLSPANSTEWSLPRGRYNFHFHNSAGLAYQIQECYDCIMQGLLESPKLPLDESVLLAELADTLRTQLGVLDAEL